MEAQKIIITGGATRIGAAIAEKLSGNNKEIVIQFNRSKLSAEKLKKKLYYNEKSFDVLKVKRVKNLSLNVRKLEKKLGLKMPSSTKAINNLIKDYK